jgi:hypothetical protein
MEDTMRFRPLLLASLLACASGPPPAQAFPCAGFTDVQDTDAFCAAVDWIRNRGVTTGCGATLYCPSDRVTRAQMALFLHRLGSTMTPDVLHKQASLGPVTIPVGPARVLLCSTDDYAVTGFPRMARLLGTFVASVGTVGEYQSVEVGWRYSSDGGATWNVVPGALPGRSAEHYASSTVVAPPMSLAVGTTYRFALWALVASGSMTPAPVHASDVVCQLEATMVGWKPLLPPPDE